MPEQLLKDLKRAIKRETDKLICESHPNVCALRDKNYARLERLIIDEVVSDRYADGVSLQTVIAGLEGELG